MGAVFREPDLRRKGGCALEDQDRTRLFPALQGHPSWPQATMSTLNGCCTVPHTLAPGHFVQLLLVGMWQAKELQPGCAACVPMHRLSAHTQTLCLGTHLLPKSPLSRQKRSTATFNWEPYAELQSMKAPPVLSGECVTSRFPYIHFTKYEKHCNKKI